MISFHIDALKFQTGDSVGIQDGDIVVFVGPSNVGKTQTLRDVRSFLADGTSIILEEVSANRRGDENALIQWFAPYDDNSKLQKDHGHVTIFGDSVRGYEIRNWTRPVPLGGLATTMCRMVAADTRLEASRTVKNIDHKFEPATHPMHGLFADSGLETRLSATCTRAFGVPVFLDRWRGNAIGLVCGPRPSAVEWSTRFQEELRRCTPLELMGDGIRSFAGCLLECLAPPHPVVLLDEPEAFLHPPQARLLGRMLAREVAPRKQILLATHSSDLLRGLLDEATRSVRVVRLTRAGNQTTAHELSGQKIQELWNDPLVRVSSILDGLFHDAVILCEGDADCRFYSAVQHVVSKSDDRQRAPDLLFVHTGGKDRMPVLVRALRAVGVRVLVVADIDVLRDKQKLREFAQCLDLDWQTIDPLRRQVAETIEQKSPLLSVLQVKSEIDSILTEESTPQLSEHAASRIREQLRRASPWAPVKLGGKAALTGGPVTVAFEHLINEFKKAGLFVVECGELERFVPSVGNKGPRWALDVLSSRDLASDPELEDARRFVTQLVSASRVFEGPTPALTMPPPDAPAAITTLAAEDETSITSAPAPPRPASNQIPPNAPASLKPAIPGFRREPWRSVITIVLSFIVGILFAWYVRR